MVRNATIGLVAFLTGLLIATLLSYAATRSPEVPMDQVNIRFDRLDEALATLDRSLGSEASRSDVGFVNPTQMEVDGNTLVQEIALMREELYGILAALETRHQPLPASESRRDVPGSAASYEAQQRSWNVLNSALAAQRWTQEDTVDLVTSWTELSTPQRQELLKTLSAAANRGEIEFDGLNGLF